MKQYMLTQQSSGPDALIVRMSQEQARVFVAGMQRAVLEANDETMIFTFSLPGKVEEVSLGAGT